jgi:uncharacterized protein YbaR (Trm112 family)
MTNTDKDCCHKCGNWYKLEYLSNGLCPFCRGSLVSEER